MEDDPAATAPVSSARQRAGETKRRRTRAAVLDAARTLFAEAGWSSTTMERIGLAAGVSTAAVYAHFPTKGVLTSWLLHGYVHEVFDPDQPAYATVAPAAAVEVFVDRLVRAYAPHRHLLAGQLHVVADSGEPQPTRYDVHDIRRVLPSIATLETLLSRAVAAGEAATYPPPAQIAAGVVHLLMLHIVLTPEIDLDAIALLGRTAVRRLAGLPEPGAG